MGERLALGGRARDGGFDLCLFGEELLVALVGGESLVAKSFGLLGAQFDLFAQLVELVGAAFEEEAGLVDLRRRFGELLGPRLEACDLAAEQLVFGGGLLEALALFAQRIDALGESFEFLLGFADLRIALFQLRAGVGEPSRGGFGALGAIFLFGQCLGEAGVLRLLRGDRFQQCLLFAVGVRDLCLELFEFSLAGLGLGLEPIDLAAPLPRDPCGQASRSSPSWSLVWPSCAIIFSSPAWVARAVSTSAVMCSSSSRSASRRAIVSRKSSCWSLARLIASVACSSSPWRDSAWALRCSISEWASLSSPVVVSRWAASFSFCAWSSASACSVDSLRSTAWISSDLVRLRSPVTDASLGGILAEPDELGAEAGDL